VAEVAIACVIQEDGVLCDDVVPPEAECVDPSSKVSFSYDSSGSCSNSSNQQDDEGLVICQDFGALPDPVIISCVDNSDVTKSLVVSPSQISSGEVVTVTPQNGDSLPASMRCVIQNAETLGVVQRNLIKLDGPLHLKEKYGALQLEACDEQQCLKTARFTYTVLNEGSHSMTVKNVTRTRKDEDTVDLAPGLSSNPIAFEGFATVSETFVLDTCRKYTCETSVDVAAHPDDGPDCDAFDDFKIEIDPACSLDVDLTCKEAETEEPCDELMDVGAETCDCLGDCAKELTFVYNAGNCSSSTGDNGLVCEDFTDSPKPCTVLVMAMAGGQSLYSDVVDCGEVMKFSNDENCLPDNLIILAMDPMGSNTAYQRVQFQTGCSDGGIKLTETYGAFEFLGFTCENGEEETCLRDLELETCAKNEGTVPMTITSSSLTFNTETVDISDIEGEEIFPGGNFCVKEVTTVSFCGDPSFEATVEVEANEECADTEDLSFTLIPRPTASPSAVPSGGPTPLPSAFPTPGPTRSPSISPTPVPTAVPTLNIIPQQGTLPPTGVPTANIIVPVPNPVPVPKPAPKPTWQSYYKGKGKGKGTVFTRNKGKGYSQNYYSNPKGGSYTRSYWNTPKGGYNKGGYNKGGYYWSRGSKARAR
jgi:hypothetical protein